jgi:hypothetical protein
MTTAVERLELSAVRPGMPVTSAGEEIGRLEDVIPQPDKIHISRLITRLRAARERLVAIPIDWAMQVRDGRTSRVSSSSSRSWSSWPRRAFGLVRRGSG